MIGIFTTPESTLTPFCIDEEEAASILKAVDLRSKSKIKRQSQSRGQSGEFDISQRTDSIRASVGASVERQQTEDVVDLPATVGAFIPTSRQRQGRLYMTTARGVQVQSSSRSDLC